MKKQTLINNLAQVGLITDIPAVELPPNGFTTAANVDFRDGAVRSSKGYIELSVFPGSGIPAHIQEYDANISYYYVVPDQTNAYSFDGNGWDDITGTPFTGGIDDKWSSMVAGNVLCLTNGVDCPQYWDKPSGGGDLTDLIWDGTDTWRDRSTIAKVIKPFKGFWMACNVNEGAVAYPHRVMWSQPTESNNIPLTWEYTLPTNLSGYLDFDQTDGVIVDAYPLGDNFVVFKDHSTYVMQHRGGTHIFTSRIQSNTYGILGKNCACEVNGQLICMVDGDIVANNGSSIQTIVEGRVRKLVFDNINNDYYHRSFVVHNISQKEVWFCFPTKGNEYPSATAIWSYDNNTWSVKTIPVATHMTHGIINVTNTDKTWDDPDGINWDDNEIGWGERSFNVINDRVIGTVPISTTPGYLISQDVVNLLGTSDPRICVFDEGDTLEGIAKHSLAERTDLPLGGDGYAFIVTKVIPRIDGTGSVTITIGGQEFEGAPVAWGQPKEYVIETDRQITCRVSGMYMAYKIESKSTNSWSCSGLEIHYRVGGKRRVSHR